MNKHTVQKLESSLHEALTARSDSKSGAPNEKIVQNHLNIALLNVF